MYQRKCRGGALPLPQPHEIESGGVEKKHVDSPYNHEAVSCNGTGGALPLPYKIPVIATSGKALLAMTGELGGFGGRFMSHPYEKRKPPALQLCTNANVGEGQCPSHNLAK